MRKIYNEEIKHSFQDTDFPPKQEQEISEKNLGEAHSKVKAKLSIKTEKSFLTNNKIGVLTNISNKVYSAAYTTGDSSSNVSDV